MFQRGDPMFRDRTKLERESSANQRTVYCGPHLALTRVLKDVLLYVDPEDVGVASRLMMDGYWESWVTIGLASLVYPGMTCVDVGAHVGYYTTLMAALTGATGQVLAFEPNPTSFTLLGKNVKVNGFESRVRCFECALSNSVNESMSLRQPIDDPGSGSILREFSSEFKLIEYPVPVTTLDAVLGGERIDFLKIDAESSDYDVLLGSQRLLAQNPQCIVLLEHCAAFYGDPFFRLAQVTALGFGLHFIDYDGSVRSIDQNTIHSQPERIWNLVLRIV